MEKVVESVLRKHRCPVLRIDYGYEAPAPRGWHTLDLAWGEPAWDGQGTGGLLVRSADDLPAWAGTRDHADVWHRLIPLAKEGRLVLVCRFPRRAVQVRDALAEAGARVEFFDAPADGAVPPLYAGLPEGSPLRRLHLEHEWSTGLAAARGGTALVRTAALLAGAGALPVSGLAGAMGITAGAARSYVRWMEDAALVRREGRSVALRHSLLNLLFLKLPVPTPPRATAFSQPKRWDPVELD